MSYQNSIKILPKELIEQIQEYIDGKVIYIPKKQSNTKALTECADTKLSLFHKPLETLKVPVLTIYWKFGRYYVPKRLSR